MQTKSKRGNTQKEERVNDPLAKTVSRFKAEREATAKKLFRGYDLELVASIAAKIWSEGTKPEAVANQALKILDACQEAISARKENFDRMVNAEVSLDTLDALRWSFRDGIRAITQEKRADRGEEYFGRFLRCTMGQEAGAKELERLKRDGFTLDEAREFQRKYQKLDLRHRKKV
jgi:hypothetical protein